MWAVFQPTWDLLYVLLFPALGLDGELPDSGPETGAERAATIAFSFAMQTPLWLALFMYGYRSQALWDRAKPSA